MGSILKKTCLILILLFAHMKLQAGGDTILNGGGQAELNTYTVIDNMQKYVEQALDKSQSLQLSKEDIQDLKQLIKYLKAQPISYPTFANLNQLAFQTDKKWGSLVTLNFKSIYESDLKPKPFLAIATITLATSIFQISNQSELSIRNCAAKVFNNFHESQQKFLLPINSQHSWHVQTQMIQDPTGQMISFISLENPRSEDLTRFIKKDLPKCQKVEFENFSELIVQSAQSGFSADAIQLQGSFRVRCYNNPNSAVHVTGQFLMNLFFDKDIWQSKKTTSQVYDLGQQP
ncbi:MAG: hypothetical protein H7235_08630 [Bdellovibrionaceae bacterium]|nr:hypothetical protein [Pseudobdellovibrionaceae bacterium]